MSAEALSIDARLGRLRELTQVRFLILIVALVTTGIMAVLLFAAVRFGEHRADAALDALTQRVNVHHRDSAQKDKDLRTELEDIRRTLYTTQDQADANTKARRPSAIETYQINVNRRATERLSAIERRVLRLEKE